MGAELQIDNETVRVTRWTLRDDEETGLHRHEYSYVVIPLVDAQMLVTLPDGSETTSTVTAGTPYFRNAGAEHNVRSADRELLDFVEVEVVR